MQVESELCGLDPEERLDFLAALNVTEDDCGLKVGGMLCHNFNFIFFVLL